MITAAVAILVASLLGSVHCAAMCGGFVCLYAGASDAHQAPIRSHLLYNVGRLISYLLLGGIAGTIGAGVSQIGLAAGFGRAAAVVAGFLMIAWAAGMIAAQRGWRVGFAPASVPAFWQRGIGRVLHAIREQPVSVRAALTGLGTTLLPCGWLYVFVASAGGTGNVRDGMAVMAIFWLGTVPALVAVGVGAQRVFGPFRRRLPTLGAVTVLLMGVLAVSGRLVMSSDAATRAHHAPAVQPAVQPAVPPAALSQPAPLRPQSPSADMAHVH